MDLDAAATLALGAVVADGAIGDGDNGRAARKDLQPTTTACTVIDKGDIAQQHFGDRRFAIGDNAEAAARAADDTVIGNGAVADGGVCPGIASAQENGAALFLRLVVSQPALVDD